jgi:LuxR family maltose regulon positive regulatory protein
VLKSDLLVTKFRCPSLPVRWVERPRLLQKLDEGLEINRRVTLVSAPAGFGKSTCIADWINRKDREPFSWLSLDSADDDPGRFFNYLIAALQKIKPDLGLEIEGALYAGQLPSAEIIATTLVNEISQMGNRFLLSLDDFHMIQDRFILEFFEKLLANPPEPLHLVLLTREDPPLPLAQLRANNLLTEIRARDLRFTVSDAARLLNEKMGLSLSEKDMSILEEKTEGWVAGLQLAGLSMRDRENPSGFIANLSGSHRYILGYLTEQVLSRQPDDIRKFLLQTSILDKLYGDLCNAVTGRKDGHALLERCFNANLFLIPLDDEGQWYRYHHLFADLLRSLQNISREENAIELHQRASRWYYQAGMVSEAIEHALAASDYTAAVDLLESHAMGMIMQGYAKTVYSWAHTIPDELGLQSPKTNLAFAWAYLLRGEYLQASEYLERLQTILTDRYLQKETPSFQAEWLVIQSLKQYMQGNITQCMRLATQGLALAPEQDNRVRSLAFYVQASAHQQMEEYPQAIQAYQKSIQCGRAAENLVAEMMSTVGLCDVLLEYGQLHLAYEIATQTVNRVERSGLLPPISAVVYLTLGDIHYQWYQIEKARKHLEHALHLSTLGGSKTVTIFCWMLLSRQSLIEGDLETATSQIQKAAELISPEGPEYIRQEFDAQTIQTYLANANLKAAMQALHGHGFSFDNRFSYPDLSDDASISYSSSLLYNRALQIILYQNQIRPDVDRLKIALDLANRLVVSATKHEQSLIMLETLLLRAQVYNALGDSNASQADYVRALQVGQAEGSIGIFVEAGAPVGAALAGLARRNQLVEIQPEYIDTILAAFRYLPPKGEAAAKIKPVEASVPSLIEPLTEREIEILKLLADSLKYKEIAEKLYISQNTVRYHIKAIYGKLNVKNRTQAIKIARQLRYL